MFFVGVAGIAMLKPWTEAERFETALGKTVFGKQVEDVEVIGVGIGEDIETSENGTGRLRLTLRLRGEERYIAVRLEDGGERSRRRSRKGRTVEAVEVLVERKGAVGGVGRRKKAVACKGVGPG